MQAQNLDITETLGQAGFRLQRCEVYNWGTFHGQVWSLNLDGKNGLLTGDIGSGKSTLVDAITTLLVPAQRITYNKSAGAEAKERSVRSYVLGYYKSERGEGGLVSRAVGLRDHNNYSVILGCFRNDAYNQDVTLAQVFWMKEQVGQPQRYYVVADGQLGIAEHFANFGSDLANLRKRLRAMPQVEIFDSFPPYGGAFRRRFGIASDQAMELFNQTVSMKSVGNLTDFVRSHMLQPFPVEPRIQALIGHFDDLHRAYQAVLKARAQIEALEPLVADVDSYSDKAQHVKALRGCREHLRPWFASLKSDLLARQIDRRQQELARLAHRLEVLQGQQGDLRGQRDDLKQAIAEQGGDRLERIKADIKSRTEQMQRCQAQSQRYRQLAEGLGLPDASGIEVFENNRQALRGQRQSMESQRASLQNQITEHSAKRHLWEDEHRKLEDELQSLRQRRSNIPAQVLAIRERLCEALELSTEELPFAGELIEVRKEAQEWEGAAERLLHNFALSLLVPDEYYSRVAEWVESTHLRGRLVYYRVRPHSVAAPMDLHPRSLVRKLAVKADSPLYDWLEAELARRFDYACCPDLESFRREQQAITPAGQIKTRGERHEKDDRRRIDDRTNYVLGWSNRAKIEALEEQQKGVATQIQNLMTTIAGWVDASNRLQEKLETVSKLEENVDFRDIDWRPLALSIAQLQEEYKALESASDVLRTLQAQLQQIESKLQEIDSQLTSAQKEQGACGNKLEHAESLRAECLALLESIEVATRELYFPQLAAMRPEALGEHQLTVESCDNRERDMREWLQRRIENEDKKLQTLRDRIIRAMEAYRHQWKAETLEVDASLAAADEYRKMLNQLRADGLPAFEARFKELLNENTIREVASFQGQLHRERETIRERIAAINRSLRGIEYNDGRYITLLAEPTLDTDVRDFQQQLRACTEGALTGSEDEQYSEQKFLQVKQIIERLRGREGLSELDKRWSRKVTDVRNWFVFSASERWKEDDTEYEHYADSGGKSGGQKEKLAYTVLAASLAYQFGLESGDKRLRTFRFVVIDEAFGRGSDKSARFGLQLFKNLSLQVLVVTPLQKVHVIEPFVANVGFAHNADGQRSMLRNLTIEEYHAEKAALKRVAQMP